ncbi:MAG: flavin reductase family protein [Candidatus Bathyarchaeota archaeon]|nr:flavin reductase family protein [Candidatus Bathyarchaeota archaeon]
MSAGKVEVNSQYSYRLLHPMHTVLVSCVGNASKPNVTAVAWAMPTSNKPPLVAISLSPQRHSHTLINESQEFVINVPTLELLQSVYACGSFSGRSFDKFKKVGLTPISAQKVKAPAIRECIAHIECTVEDQVTTGDHTVFVGKVIAAYANPGVFTERYALEKARMLYHAGGNNFAVLDPKIYKP